MTATTSPPSPPSTPGATPRARRWPRRLAIGVVVTGALVGGAAWLLGRESTLQLLVQKLASASGGNISASGVSGSLVGAMHITELVYRTPEQLVTIDNIDIDWSPLQFFSNGVEVNKLTVASLRKQTLKPSPPATMPTRITPPFAITVSDARLAKVDLDGTVIADVRFQLHGDGAGWQLNKAAATTPWGKATAAASIAAASPFKVAGSAEYQYWFKPPYGVAVFYDAGNAADSFKKLAPKSGYGVGARWRSPVGPINVDVAYGHAVQKYRLHFSLGFTF